MSDKPPTQGNGPARALLGLMGALLIAGGILITYLAVTKWPLAIFSGMPGVFLIGYGTTLLFACAFYDDVIIERGPFGFPIVTGRKSQQ